MKRVHKVSEVLKLLNDDGWRLKNIRGDHRQFVHPTKRGKVTVAGKLSESLLPKTLKSIQIQARIDF
jgi:predicted RNA binding protein YcfA (HicA-like mRNA interferase family)